MTTSQALDIYHCPLENISLIEASAGTGKTWAICGLVLRLLLEKKFEIHEILVVTFTQAATAELRARIRGRLLELLEAIETGDPGQDPFICQYLMLLNTQEQEASPPEAAATTGQPENLLEIARRLRAALARFDEAAIFTIHGFCQRALGETPFAAAQSFQMTLENTPEIVVQVSTDFWRKEVIHRPHAPAFMEWLSRRRITPDHWTHLLEQALRTPLAQALWPTELPVAPPSLTEQEESSLWADYQTAATLWHAEADQIKTLLHTRLADLKYLTAEAIALAGTGWDAYFAAGSPLAPLPEKALDLRQSVLTYKKTRAGKTAPTHAFFEWADRLHEAKSRIEHTLEQTYHILLRHFLAIAPAEVARLKQERHQMDFNDLLIRLHQAVTGKNAQGIIRHLQQRYPAALIDEFQDTDPLQFSIFDTLYGSGEAPVFWVGDPKQAIYSFRQADLHTYLAARPKARHHYYLDANQRSCPAVIQGVNALFSANPQAFMLPDLDFLATHRGSKPLPQLEDSSGGPQSGFQIWLLPDQEETLLSRRQAFERAAAACAEETARLLKAAGQGQFTLDGQALRPDRIAILVRTHRQGKQIKTALARVGLQAAELAQSSVFLSQEAESLERVLRAMAEPGNSGYLKAALASPLFGLDALEIAALTPEKSITHQWKERLQQAQQHWQNRGIRAGISLLDPQNQISTRLLGLNDGERRLTNYLHLLELLQQAERQHLQPSLLLQWFCRQRRQPDQDDAAQLRLESDRNLVNIVTIHKSKGLEYDIVFCPFLWEGFPRSTGSGDRVPVFHDTQGQLIIDYSRSEHGKHQASLEQAAEMLRLYYVALTRAVHRCYLISGLYGKPVRGSSLSLTESSKSLLNWLVAGQGITAETWLAGSSKTLPPPRQIVQAWRALVQPPDICIAPLPEAGLFIPTPPQKTQEYSAPPLSRHLLPQWRIDSFSGLVRHLAGHEQDASSTPSPPETGEKVDEITQFSLASPPVSLSSSQEIPPDDFLHFPRGVRAGHCVHGLLEQVDFTQENTWMPAVEKMLALHFPGVQNNHATYQRMLYQLLNHTLNTPLPEFAARSSAGAHIPTAPDEQSCPVFYLKDLSPAQKRVELEFHLPVHRLNPETLFLHLDAYGEPPPSLDFKPLEGYLKGFIDLVFEYQGRYYVLDWKTNHLGWQSSHYAPQTLEQVMTEHAYTLQARLYLLALHRLLTHRLPDYNPARHLGGAYYLFLRGLRPAWQTDCTSTTPPGVVYLPPKPELLAALDPLFMSPAPPSS